MKSSGLCTACGVLDNHSGPDNVSTIFARGRNCLSKEAPVRAAEVREPAHRTAPTIFRRRVCLARNGRGNSARLQITLACGASEDCDLREQLRRSWRDRFLWAAAWFAEIDLQSS